MSNIEAAIKKPETITDMVSFLDKAVQKVLRLTPVSFGKFTPNHLPDDYLYDKWLGKEKDFSDVYLNMDSDCQAHFIKYAVGKTEDEYHLAARLHRFFLFCWNYDSSDFCEDPFAGKYGEMLTRLATGKKKVSGIKAMQVVRLFNQCDFNGKYYLTWCAFGVKK